MYVCDLAFLGSYFGSEITTNVTQLTLLVEVPGIVPKSAIYHINNLCAVLSPWHPYILIYGDTH